MITKKWLGMMSSVGLPLLFGVIVFVLWQTQALHSWLGTDTITLPLPTRIGEIISQNKDSVGRQIRENIVKGQYPTAWAYIATACAIGIGMYIILMLVERLVLKRRKA